MATPNITLDRDDAPQPRPSGSATQRYLNGPEPLAEYARLGEEIADLLEKAQRKQSERCALELHLKLEGRL